MLKLLRNTKGSIGLSLVVAIIAALSGVSLSSVAFRDSRSIRMQFDALQEFHLIRAEVSRARLVLSYHDIKGDVPQHIYLPLRLTEVLFGSNRSVYTTNTRIEKMGVGAGATSADSYVIRTLVSAFRGNQVKPHDTESKSVVQRYAENVVDNLQTMAIFHYFTDIDAPPGGGLGDIRFYGQDAVHGRVHSNSDIYIRQIGGGPNDGWPIFTGLVTTAGTIKVYPGGGTTYPKNQIFRGGLIENYPVVRFDHSMDLVLEHGRAIFGNTPADNKIAYVTVNGSSYTGYVGEIVRRGVETLTVYNSYPPYGEIGDSIGISSVPIVDTLWSSPQVGNLSNSSAYIPFDLWISGDFGGRQTWASTKNVYLKGDITYRGTPKGSRPDDDNNPNPRDYLGVIAGEKMFIQYGHRSPVDGTRYRPNTEDIYMYGAFLASGDGGGDSKKDGVVTFEYHFPKGSTPDQPYWISPPCGCPDASTGKVVSGSLDNKSFKTANNANRLVRDDEPEWLTKIDMHLNFYPTTNQRPWDRGIDYPYYNPLWPEPGPIYPSNPAYAGFTKTPVPDEYVDDLPRVVWLRGTIHLYGSIAQRRRGFVRRSGQPDFDAGPDIPWNLEEQLYGLNVGPTGYDKNYNFDNRFEKVGPPHFPLVKFESDITDAGGVIDLGYRTRNWVFKSPRENF